MHSLEKIDPAIYSLIGQEKIRENEEIDLIASENYASTAIFEAAGSLLTNKYAEGYPGKRYYGGCQIVDQVEQLAIDRCKKLFNAEHANVQPHAGSQANMAVYFAALKPGDTLMGLELVSGGHLTHGHKVSFSGTFYKSVSYGVDETGRLDYDAIEKLAEEHKPKLIICGYTAYARTIDFNRFAQIAKKVGAVLHADIAHIAGLVAVGLHPSPLPVADYVTTTTHKTLRGPRGGLIMCKKENAERLDRAIIPGLQGGPLMHIIAAKAVCFQEALQPSFKTYQQQILANAKKLAQTFLDLGYDIVTGGTDNHLFILDLRNKKITGLEAEQALEKAGLTVSRSCIPRDPQSPRITSGIRIGSPAVTTRGMKEKEMGEIASFIDEVIKNHKDETFLKMMRDKIKKYCINYPVY